MTSPRIEELLTAYANEKATERLLPYNEVVDAFAKMIEKAPVDLDEPGVIKMIREVERERMKYFTREYLLTRLEKLNANFFLDKRLMSPREVAYYERYLALVEKSGVKISGPGKSKSFECVGFYCTSTLDSVRIDNEIIEIHEGDFFIAGIDDVIEYLLRGKIVLI